MRERAFLVSRYAGCLLHGEPATIETGSASLLRLRKELIAMKTETLLVGLAAAFALGMTGGCGSDDDGGGGSGGSATGGVAGTATGGAAGTATGGAAGTATGGAAGTATGGAAGTATGGAAGTATGGAAGTATGGAAGAAGSAGAGGGKAFFPNPYDANCQSDKYKKNHNTDQNCMTCHGPTGKEKEWLFGGTIWQTGGSVGAAKVEVGVSDGTNFYYACTDPDGKFFVEKQGGATINWATAETRMRNANGEKKMIAKPTAACNTCHASQKLIQP